MKIAKSAMLMAAGALAVMVYQKYSEPLMCKMQDIADDMIDKVNDKLEDMK